MGYGIKAHIGVSFQNSFGTLNVDSMHYFPIISESLTKNIPPLMSEAVRGRYEAGPSYEAMHELAGDIVFDAHPVLLGKMLKGWFGQASGTLTNSYYSHEFNPITDDFDKFIAVPPMSIEVYRDAGSAHLFYDAAVNQLVIEIAHNNIVKCTASVIAAKHQKLAKSTPSYLPGSDYTFDQASFSFQGSSDGAVDAITAFTITLNNNLEASGTLNVSRQPGRIKRTSFRTIDLSGSMLFEDDNEVDHYHNSAEQRVVATLLGQTIGGTDRAKAEFDFPSFRYTEFPPNVAGMGLISVSFAATAKYNAGSGTMATFTLQNTLSQY